MSKPVPGDPDRDVEFLRLTQQLMDLTTAEFQNQTGKALLDFARVCKICAAAADHHAMIKLHFQGTVSRRESLKARKKSKNDD